MGGGKSFWNFFWSIFSPNQAISKHFSFFSLFPKFFEISRFSGKNRVKWGVRGVPTYFFWLESYYICYLVAHAEVWNPGIYLKIGHFPVKIGLIGGVRGVPEIRFSLESSSFCYLGAHAKFHNPSCLLSGRKATTSGRKKEREKKKISASADGGLAPRPAYWNPPNFVT